MNNFKDFGIDTASKAFVGNSIEIEQIFNKPIIVYAFKIEKSKYEKTKGNGLCLHMQIEFEGKKRVVFTGSVSLQTDIKKVLPDKFPFNTTIVRNGKRFDFT